MPVSDYVIEAALPFSYVDFPVALTLVGWKNQLRVGVRSKCVDIWELSSKLWL